MGARAHSPHYPVIHCPPLFHSCKCLYTWSQLTVLSYCETLRESDESCLLISSCFGDGSCRVVHGVAASRDFRTGDNKSLLGTKINVLPLCFPMGSLILCYDSQSYDSLLFFKRTKTIYRNMSTVASHNRWFYSGGALGIASISKLLKSCDDVEVMKAGSELRLDS